MNSSWIWDIFAMSTGLAGILDMGDEKISRVQDGPAFEPHKASAIS